MSGAFDPVAFDTTAFDQGGVAPSVSVTVSPSIAVTTGQYIAGLGQVVSLGVAPGTSPGAGLILYPETGELEVQDRYTPKVPSRARRTYR